MYKWKTILNLINILENNIFLVNAPVAKDASEFRINQERKFQQYTGNTNTIPEDYKDRLDLMIENIKTHMNISERKSMQRSFWCDVIQITLKLIDNRMIIDHVHTRPCAQSCGIYRYLLWNLGQYIVQNHISKLILTNCSDENVYILEKMGFTDPNDGAHSSPNMEIGVDDLRVKVNDNDQWNVPSSFPPADLLNNQEFVDRFVNKKKENFTW